MLKLVSAYSIILLFVSVLALSGCVTVIQDSPGVVIEAAPSATGLGI